MKSYLNQLDKGAKGWVEGGYHTPWYDIDTVSNPREMLKGVYRASGCREGVEKSGAKAIGLLFHHATRIPKGKFQNNICRQEPRKR